MLKHRVLAGGLVLLAWATVARAQIPASLKASCATQNPEPGYSFLFCDDGVPPAGGTTANPGGTSAVLVPAKYDGWEGLPPKSADASSMAGADAAGNVALDVDISIPTLPPPASGYPLMVMMHGCCSGNKTGWEATSFDAGGERWHYSNAWFASRGYVVLTYTARGFVDGMNHGSTGETQLDSRRFEINDFQYLAGLVADDPFFHVNPERVVVTGGSYGGGFSWLAFTDPIWTSPGGKPMKLAAAAPKYGWTDLLYSLVPTGEHFQTPDALPPFDASASTVPIGIPKRSINAALYASGKTGIPPGGPHTTFPSYIDDALTCLSQPYPFDANPLCQSTIDSTMPAFISDRSAYYQTEFFAHLAAHPAYRTPLFNAATLTDPLFTPVENRRMANRLLQAVPGYPIQQYFGDYQHFVQNKAKEWGDICGFDRHVCTFNDYPSGNVNRKPRLRRRMGVTTRLNRFVDRYAEPPGNPHQSRPRFDVTASLQICPQNASARQPADEPGKTFRARTFETLARGTLRVDMTGSLTTTSQASPNPHAIAADPVANLESNGGKCPVATDAAGPGVATYESDPLPATQTMLGAAVVSVDYSATGTTGLELNARLYDVLTDGTTAVMVDRGVRRVTAASGTLVYQLHGNGWQFPRAHRIRIELAQDDDPYLKRSDVPSSATLTHVRLDIPVRERGALTLGGAAKP